MYLVRVCQATRQRLTVTTVSGGWPILSLASWESTSNRGSPTLARTQGWGCLMSAGVSKTARLKGGPARPLLANRRALCFHGVNLGAGSAICFERSLDRLDLRTEPGDLRLLQTNLILLPVN